MLSKKDYKYLEKLINKFDVKKKLRKTSYPLLEKGFDSKDILKGMEVLLSKNITMSNITKKFENEFAKFIGSKYALMVNSGSSANLLSSFALINPKKKNHLKRGDKFIIPATCWSTSLWPLIQCGLKPEFIDVNINNYCLDESLLRKKNIKKIKAILDIHILGNSSNIKEISRIAKKNNIFLIEDTCEALGSRFGSKYLGTFGDFGTYSFYYSHQITSGEGGMIVCKTKEDYNLIYTMRSHGWDRGLRSGKKKTEFNFVNSGFNLRPLDISAAIGLSQLKRLKKTMVTRTKNRNLIVEEIKKSNRWNNQFDFFNSNENVKSSWFGFPILINKLFLKNKQNFIKYLNISNIETRPIISGNFLNQPGAKLYKLDQNPKKFKISQEIEDRGFFIGLPTKPISKETLKYLSEKLLYIDNL